MSMREYFTAEELWVAELFFCHVVQDESFRFLSNDRLSIALIFLSAASQCLSELFLIDIAVGTSSVIKYVRLRSARVSVLLKNVVRLQKF